MTSKTNGWIFGMLLGASLLVVSIAQGQIYFTNEFGTLQGVNSMDVDGSNASHIISTATRTRGIALDIPNNHMYWTDWSLGTLSRSNLDGTSQTTLLTGLGNPQSVQLDLTNNKMYFTVQSVGIRSANLDGTGLSTVAAVGLDPEGLALDVANSHIYYVQQDVQQVRRVDFAGTNDILLYQDNDDLNDIGLDTASGKMYWTSGVNGGSTGTIKRANLDGSTVETQLSGLGWTYGMALDVSNSFIYYAITDGSTPANSSINRVNFDGTGNTNLITGGVAEGARELALVPEPSTYALIFGAAAIGLVLLRRKFLSR